MGNCSHVTWSGPPGTFYNGMIAPTARTIRPAAAVYYQGENNMWDHIDAYHCSGDALAASWRAAFSDDDAVPWFVVQLAPCAGNNFGLFAGDNVREAQRRTSLSTPDAHLIVLTDLGDAGNDPDGLGWQCGRAPATHPKNKTEPGRRLGMQMWNHLFATAGDQPLVASGPVLESVSRSGSAVIIRFNASTSRGLHWLPTHNCSCYTDGGPCCTAATAYAQLSNDTLPDQTDCRDNPSTWINGTASLKGGMLSVAVPPGFVPKWVRFQYVSQPLCVLANEAGLPASLFVAPVPE